jgi:hypothetical protein
MGITQLVVLFVRCASVKHNNIKHINDRIRPIS